MANETEECLKLFGCTPEDLQAKHAMPFPQAKERLNLSKTNLNPPYSGTGQEWLDSRYKAQRDLFYLGRHILHLDLVDTYICREHPSETGPEPRRCVICDKEFELYPGAFQDEDGNWNSIHRYICNSFVQKDPTKAIFEQDKRKFRLILCARGTFKSTCDAVDAAQWVVDFPNIRVVVFSASPDLGEDFVALVKNWFSVTVDDKDNIHCNASCPEFQHLFPECLITAGTDKKDKYVNPARTNSNLIDPTLFTLPLIGNTAGHHADVGKFDDCISDVNCGPNSTEDQRKKVGQNLITKRKIILLSGYKDYLGTPYATDDYYSQAIENRYLTSRVFDIVRIRGAMDFKPGVEKRDIQTWTEDGVHLVFPFDGKGEPHLTLEALKKEALDDYVIFAAQYLCDPRTSRTATFTEQMIQSHTVSTANLPQSGEFEAFAAWDLASSSQRYSDYSVGAVGYFCTAGPLCGRLFIMEIRMGKWAPTDLAFQIADQAARWHVKGLGIEKSPGAENLESSIMIELNRLGYFDAPRPIWFPVSVQKDAKNFRAESLETMFIQDRLWFSNQIPIMEEVTKQFVNFKPHSKRKDDAVDAIAYLTRFQPSVVPPKNEQERREALYDFLRQKAQYERVFEHPPAPRVPDDPAPEAPTTWEGMRVWANSEEQFYGGS